MDEHTQDLLRDMRRQLGDLATELWNARQRGEHRKAYDLELARDDLRRALKRLKGQETGDGALRVSGTGLGTCPVE